MHSWYPRTFRDTAYVAKRMTFKLPSFIDQSQPPIKLPVSRDVADPSFVSLKQAGPSQASLPALTASTSKPQPNAKSSLSSSQSQSRATSENLKSHSLTTKSKGRLSNEALAKGWGIETSHKRVSSHGTTRVTRPSLEAGSSGSSKKRGRPEPTGDDEAASSAAPLASAKVGSDTADQGFQKGSKSKKAPPARPKSRTEKSQSTQSADTDIISRKDQKSKAVNDDLVGSRDFKVTSAISPHLPTSNLSTSPEIRNRRNMTELSKDSSVPLRENTNRKKRKVSQPTQDDTQLSDANKDAASSSTDHSQPKARKDESRTNQNHLELQPTGIIDAKSRNFSNSNSRTTTLTKKEKRPESNKIPNLPNRGIEANRSNMPWKPLDSVDSPVTPAYAKAFPSLTSTLQRTIASPADPIVNRRLSTQLSDITNTIHSARPSGTLTTTTQTSKNPEKEVVRISKTVKKGTAKLDPMVKSLEQEESLALSDRGKRLGEQHQQASSSDTTQMAEGTSTKPQASINDDISASDAAHVRPPQNKGRSVIKDLRKNRSESPDTVDSDVGTHRPHVENSTSLNAGSASGSTTNKRSIDPSPKWSALDTEVPQPKKLKKLAHKVFTPGKPSGNKGHTTRDRPDEVPPVGLTMHSNQAKNTCNEDELYVVTDRFVDDEDLEDLEPTQSNENSKLLIKIKNQLNPPDIVWISIRKLLQDEIDNLPKSYEIENHESKEKEWLERVYDRFKLRMMEYSEEIIKHGLLKLKLQKLIEQEKTEKKTNEEVQENGVTQVPLSSSSLKNQGLDEKPKQSRPFKKDKKINVSAEVDDLVNKPTKNLSNVSKPIKTSKPNKNRGKSNSKTKKAK
ncbi:uncharacterized protein MELLADRAFT_110946 [Melampsora larici-populina 98AG31]|uniref:Uncharacterized protein n=1 Tax=Melampsora larici-populina (strain 98AG31 / pathotype 3-4-7) TaxID=747676 RepID=F4S1I7_MELLP|nr:uncharacterized protein MELLADRAFT_110946 [Melampsora larici-populina 98AG31]EGG01382.1 hypothetical protein MELLADRAFT_110946 [Melampsora larici-populina 98AG31]